MRQIRELVCSASVDRILWNLQIVIPSTPLPTLQKKVTPPLPTFSSQLGARNQTLPLIFSLEVCSPHSIYCFRHRFFRSVLTKGSPPSFSAASYGKRGPLTLRFIFPLRGELLRFLRPQESPTCQHRRQFNK